MSDIDLSAIKSGRYVLQRGGTEAHFHTDPKLFEQENVANDLKPGMLVYMDTDGKFKPAIAISQRQSNIQGIVYSLIGNDKVYIKHNHGHMFFRHPLPPDWFFTIDGKVVEDSPLFEKVPNTLGNTLYLSDTIPGGLMSNPPLNDMFVVLAGYRTEYGFYFKPEPYCCESMKDYNPNKTL
jgi:hypothetical protein